MELLRAVCIIIIWCSTIVRYACADGNLLKEPCANRKSKRVSNRFDSKDDDSGDMFDKSLETAKVKKVIEVSDNGFYSALCWIEITTVTEFKNGSSYVTREYAISFESPANIPKKYLAKNNENDTEIVTYKIYDKDTHKSEVVNFTTSKKKENVTIRQNRKILCGSGPIYTKEYTEWLKLNKQKVELRVSPKKQSLVAKKCNHPDDEDYSRRIDTVEEIRIKSPEDLENSAFQNLPNDTSFAGRTLPQSEKEVDDSHKVITTKNTYSSTEHSTTKFVPNDKTTTIIPKLSSENLSTPRELESGKTLSARPTLNQNGVTDKVIDVSSQLKTESPIVTKKLAVSAKTTNFDSKKYPSSRELTSKSQKVVTETTPNHETTEKIHTVSVPQKVVTLNPNYLNADSSVRLSVTNFPILNLLDENLPSADDSESETSSTENWSTPSTTTDSPQSIKVSRTNSELKYTQTPKEENNTLSTIIHEPEYKNGNVSLPSQASPDKYSTIYSIKNDPKNETGKVSLPTQTPLKEKSMISTLKYDSKNKTENGLVSTEAPQEESSTIPNVVKYDTKNKTGNVSVPTQVPQEKNGMISTIKYVPKGETGSVSPSTQPQQEENSIIPTIESKPEDETSNVLLPIELNDKDFQKLNIPLNETIKKIRVRVNVLVDYISEGDKDGKIYKKITPIIGVERKLELNAKLKGLKTCEMELDYDWDKFIVELVGRFFNNTIGKCNDRDSKRICNKVPNLINKTDDKLVELLTPSPKPNNLYLLYQNSDKPTYFNKYKEKFESMNDFVYPSFKNSENDSISNSAILIKNKKPHYRFSSLTKPEYKIPNFVNSQLNSSGSHRIPSAILQKLLNLTKTSSLDNFDKNTKGNISHSEIFVGSFKSKKSAEYNDGHRMRFISPRKSDEGEVVKPEFNIVNLSKFDPQLLENYDQLGLNVPDKNVGKKNKTIPNNLFGILTASFSNN